MNTSELKAIATAMVASGKGILAADESTGTIKKRFDSIGVESTEETRRDYREMLFRSTEAMENYISGVILFDETFRQKAADGTPLVKLIKQAGSIPGIKVDAGAHNMAGHDGEMITEGLDGLRPRMEEYYALGARFAKWRGVINIGNNMPSQACINANTHALARYAAICQENGIVPIVEPEVIMDGDHSAERCLDVTSTVLSALFAALDEQSVYLEGTILKPNMIVSGTTNPEQASIEKVAEMTLDCFHKCVPTDIPGIVFLSGGQSDLDATAHLNAMNKNGPLPWKVGFSYGRALQAAPLKTWSGKVENVEAAKQAFTHRARMNTLAALGQWDPSLEA